MALPSSTSLIAAIDGGTTHTRLRLWNGREVVWRASQAVGSRDVAQYGKQMLEAAILELLAKARAAYAFERIVASGMITSDMGLREIPHLQAPVRYDQLAAAISAELLPSIGRVHFIPGVKTIAQEAGLAAIAQLDVMRGEETEIVGLRDALALSGPINFFHAGSHHKLVRTDDDAILGSATTLCGELLAALLQHTILASSALPLAAIGEVDHAYWDEGLRTARHHAFGRAAFCVRLADQLLHAAPAQATSFLLGAAASLDLPLIPGGIPLVLYGHSTVTLPLARYLGQQGMQTRIVDQELGEIAAARGAAVLLQTNRISHKPMAGVVDKDDLSGHQ